MSWIEKYFSEEEIKSIQTRISEVEKSTSGEIRLSVREKRSFLEKLYKPHELAVKDFEKLGIAGTKNKTGILIFLIFDEKFYDILADEGINEKIPDKAWNELEEQLKGRFREGNYSSGIMFLIGKIGEILAREFPRTADDVDELPDELVVG